MEPIMNEQETTQDQEPITTTPETSPEALQARVAELEQAYEEQKNLYLRTLADFQNYRRRQHEEIERQRGLLLESLMQDLLPILDNFERALQAAEATRELEPLLEGVRMTERQIKAVLERYDIHPIIAIGQPFDPNLHEAIQRVETVDYEDGTVIDEVERGYRMGERVLRPSRVIVAKRPESPQTQGLDVQV
ncbi:MAG: nucleotide exchange factor GrpE [Armatimonadetes bacterium JP3_11]|jgi:molecular chaperone GrpE|nr:MAG: nucleotide exchange factor GrpE [Armatimonadetes bacterium CP1_7O]OYT74335.1 MAG: nucleotide exchange factor GrpE [Armatimonadetes bacterium JP3_11]RMH09843.1 MAG: nucleotide exchange factor GrpE [Armatimonadota bacterium]